MNPNYVIEPDSLYLEDGTTLLSAMGALKFTVITDPPYNIGYKYSSYTDHLSDGEYINMMAEFQGLPSAIISYPEETMRYLAPALGAPDEVLVWCYNSNIHRQSRLISIYGAGVHFDRVKQPYKNPNDKRIKKLVQNGSTGTPMYDWFTDIQLEKNVCKDKREYPHPCPVPVKLMERLIILLTGPGDIVYDPFMGSGTTAIACMRTGRHYIGAEIDEAYFTCSCERVDAELKAGT